MIFIDITTDGVTVIFDTRLISRLVIPPDEPDTPAVIRVFLADGRTPLVFPRTADRLKGLREAMEVAARPSPSPFETKG